jgi:hypothetical protein
MMEAKFKARSILTMIISSSLSKNDHILFFFLMAPTGILITGV